MSFYQGLALDPLVKWVSLQHPQILGWILHSKATVFAYYWQRQDDQILVMLTIVDEKRKFIQMYLNLAQTIKINPCKLSYIRLLEKCQMFKRIKRRDLIQILWILFYSLEITKKNTTCHQVTSLLLWKQRAIFFMISEGGHFKHPTKWSLFFPLNVVWWTFPTGHSFQQHNSNISFILFLLKPLLCFIDVI